MRPVLTADEMFSLEKAYFDSGAPSRPLMRRAALGVCARMADAFGPLHGLRIAALCGRGNNGGDGWGAAGFAAMSGARVTVVDASDPDRMKPDAAAMRAMAIEAGVTVTREIDPVPCPDIWIDALFGIGLNRPVDESSARLIDRMERDRQRGARVVAVDIPSGLDPDSGLPGGACVRADLTVTFQHLKRGHLLGVGPDQCGPVAVCPIGLDAAPVRAALTLVTDADAVSQLPVRRQAAHKGDYGRLLIVAGSMGLCGAALYAAGAALRFGTGLVTLAVPRSAVPVMQAALPGAMCLALAEVDGRVAPEAAPALEAAISARDALVVGPGLGPVDPRVIRACLTSGKPAVLDADALNVISRERSLLSLLGPKHVITPHPGEAARLLERPVADPVADAQALNRLTGAVALLKGAATVIAGERTTLSASGCGGMATGGSGDVLSGLIGALLSQGVSPEPAAWAAAHIHGLCGTMAAEDLTQTCMNAADLVAYLPRVMKALQAKYGRTL